MKTLRLFFCNDDGTPSSNRFFLGIILLMLLLWSNLIVCKTLTIPEIPQTWVYVIGIFSSVVLGTKITTGVETVKGCDNATIDTPPAA